jgi:hypothetical protein
VVWISGFIIHCGLTQALWSLRNYYGNLASATIHRRATQGLSILQQMPHQDRFIGLSIVLCKSLRSSFWQSYATNTHLTRHYFYHNLGELISPITLQERGESVPNQAGKPTQRPTMRRIFQMFEGIDLLVIKTPEGVQRQVLNLKPVHRQILRLLGPNVEKCYLDSS